MIGPGLEGAAFSAYAYGYASGLTGSLTVSMETSDGFQVIAPTTADIIEIDVGGAESVYRWTDAYPAAGEYIVIWEDPDGLQAAEELVSSADVSGIEPPSPSFGPCQPWIDGDDVAECCGVEPGSEQQSNLDSAAEMASALLYRLSLKKYPGLCLRTVRPCRTGCACSHVGEGWFWRGTEWVQVSTGTSWRACSCGCVNQILLSGVARAIVEVRIDGELLTPDGYRLDEYKYLVRMADADNVRQAWPRCQRLDLPSSEPGTFEVTYLAGMSPPPLGVAAASRLACELFRGCSNGGDCALPSGVTRIIRAGLEIEKVDTLSGMLHKGATGLPVVDAFMAFANPSGAMSVPTLWSPDITPHRRMA
jgi:hypothetical protein